MRVPDRRSWWVVLFCCLLVVSTVQAGPFDEEPVRAVPREGAGQDAVAAPVPPERSPSLFAKAKGLFGKGASVASDWAGRLGALWKEGTSILKRVKNIPGWFRQGTLSAAATRELKALAAARPEQVWTPSSAWPDARNAHRTNTREELRDALKGEYNWLECDVRLEGPARNRIPMPLGARRPIVAHDSYQTNGLLFSDWLSIVKETGRGLKLDFKQSAALDDCLGQLKAAGIPDHRLILNIGVPAPSPETDLSRLPRDDRTDRIRSAFPGAVINLSPSGDDLTDGHYSDRTIAQLIRFARKAGPPVMFPLRAELVTPAIVQALRPHGRIAIWNSPYTYNPPDVEEAIRTFRAWGVDGMIDIMTKGH